jgi:hypothetical protein
MGSSFMQRIILIFATGILFVLISAVPSYSFPLRNGIDCFYGNGEPDSEGFGTWMGYAVEFEPPFTPYVVDAVSIYVSQAYWSGSVPELWVAVLDDDGSLKQYAKLGWDELGSRRGWVMIPLANATYMGKFTVIVNSGVGLPPSVSGSTVSPVFNLGVESIGSDIGTLLYTSDKSPEFPPILNVTNAGDRERISNANLSKLVNATNVIPSMQSRNWMIRAHAPGLEVESPRIVITQEDLEKFVAQRDGIVLNPEWTLPPIEELGPRSMIHAPTSLAGVTFYYYQEDRERKFIFPHDGPWANHDLIAALGRMCSDMSQEGLIGLEHIGIYNDRNIYGTNTTSSHAYGLGIDISGFQFSDGRVYMVEDHDDPEVRAMLIHIKDTYLKKYFTTVLDWTYQRHNNHFHVNLPYNP